MLRSALAVAAALAIAPQAHAAAPPLPRSVQALAPDLAVRGGTSPTFLARPAAPGRRQRGWLEDRVVATAIGHAREHEKGGEEARSQAVLARQAAAVGEHDIKSAWCGRVFYTLDDYPFVERRHGGRVITFAAPSDHGNSLAAKVGQLVGELAAHTIVKPATEPQIRAALERSLAPLSKALPS